MHAAVTGGAGFIGSYLVDRLVAEGREVTVFDNLSAGKRELVHDQARLIELDLLDFPLLQDRLKGFDTVYHLAAQPDVRKGLADPQAVMENNYQATFNLLEAMRLNGIRKMVFASTSAVYGETQLIPTPETAETRPISVYGATKLACEALVSAYCETFALAGVVLRMANVVGPRSTHGVLFDFIGKLKEDKARLEVLGDGRQQKSYLYIDDCIDALIWLSAGNAGFRVFNIGSEDAMLVSEIAKLVRDRFSPGAKIIYAGGATGWKGDIKRMQLDISRAKAQGWKPSLTSRQAVAKTLESLGITV